MDKGASEYYQFPDNHQHELRNFMRFLLFGLLGIVLLLGSVIWFADRLLTQIPFSLEKRFVTPYITLFKQHRELTPEQLQVEESLQTLVAELGSAMQLEEGMDITVYLLPAAEQNAFATLGGHIFVFEGLVEAMPDENSLSMVLAHELAHIKQRDPIVSISRGALVQIFYGFVTGDAGGVFSTGSEIGMLFFSREQETEADLIAVETLQRNYGHVAGATTFFERLAQSQPEEDSFHMEWLSTHPDLLKRIDQIEAYIKERGFKREAVRRLDL
ncbi:M48 family metallopeptidase [uncultured Neptuniibacter sp.]|uniref:M48 family metallopeptidase n=1 Tax=uncultured Neptuniibacter sp. TaxID=502143 RepID=UPI00262B748E|nr:M48 family metallopeptidase [uncultured Neptuniibacter sp.]